MSTVTTSPIKQIVLSNSSFGPQDVQHIVDAISEEGTNFRTLREAVSELEAHEELSPASQVRLGVCYYLLGRYQVALETLRNGDGGALALFYIGKTYFALEQYDKAQEH